MRVMQILLLLTIVVGVKSDGAPFNECATDAQCPADQHALIQIIMVSMTDVHVTLTSSRSILG